MASAKPTLNPLTETPTNKTQVTKPFMLAYIKSELADEEDRAWFKSLCVKHKVMKVTNLGGEEKEYPDIDIPEVRKAFCERFFPNLVAKKKTKSFFDEILDL
mgnify:CR=1 FL=1